MVFSGTFQNCSNLVHKKGVGTATERVELDELHVHREPRYFQRGLDHPVGVGPLGDNIQLGKLSVVGPPEQVVREHVRAHIGKYLPHLLLHQRIGVVGPTCHDKHQPVFTHRLVKPLLLRVSQLVVRAVALLLGLLKCLFEHGLGYSQRR